MLEFAWDNIKLGFKCICNVDGDDTLALNDGTCQNSWLYILGYTLSLFIIQYNINSIMHHKFTRTAEYIYAFMVPISVLAFYCAIHTIGIDHIKNNNIAVS